VFLSQNRHFFANFFSENIFKIITSVPGRNKVYPLQVGQPERSSKRFKTWQTKNWPTQRSERTAEDLTYVNNRFLTSLPGLEVFTTFTSYLGRKFHT
jgi:hypothetical protein